jgi:hypothetical protein
VPDDRVVCENVLNGPIGNLLSVMENDRSPSESANGMHHMLDDDDGNSGIAYIAKQYKHLPDLRPRKACHHLVERQKLRTCRQGAGNFGDASALADSALTFRFNLLLCCALRSPGANV